MLRALKSLVEAFFWLQMSVGCIGILLFIGDPNSESSQNAKTCAFHGMAGVAFMRTSTSDTTP